MHRCHRRNAPVASRERDLATRGWERPSRSSRMAGPVCCRLDRALYTSGGTPAVSESTVAAETCEAIAAANQQFDAYPAREVALGHLAVIRALPVKGKRLIGPWCFLDRFGPATFGRGGGMDVAPHPHIGLQTVTWLLDGEIVHDDSLEQEAVLRPGGVNIMTSGRAIAHAERTPDDNTGRLSGVQLWTALPDRDRHGPPSFQHLAEVPRLEPSGGIVRVFSGAIAGAASPAEHFCDLVGAELQ